MLVKTLVSSLVSSLVRPLSGVAAIIPATNGMTLTEAWVTRGTAYTSLASSIAASVRVDATISNADSGILMESGATGTGLILYVFEGVLYFECGKGVAFGTSWERAATSYVLPVGPADYVVEWSSSVSNTVLYVNGVLVDSQVSATPLMELGGTNSGTVGRVSDKVAVNRGGWVSDGSGDYTNTITRCDVFNGQVTADV